MIDVSRRNSVMAGIAAYAVLHRCLEVFRFEPEKAHHQLPQVIPVVTNRQFARSQDGVWSPLAKIGTRAMNHHYLSEASSFTYPH
jgi:hypothetical protein